MNCDDTVGVMASDAPQEFFCNKCGYFGPVEVFHERPNGSGKCDYMAVPMKARESRCKVPPPGWSCSREPGHGGPCAARTSGVEAPMDADRKVLQQALDALTDLRFVLDCALGVDAVRPQEANGPAFKADMAINALRRALGVLGTSKENGNG